MSRKSRRHLGSALVAAALAVAACSQTGDHGRAAPQPNVAAAAPAAGAPAAAPAPVAALGPAPTADPGGAPRDRVETESYLVEVVKPEEPSAGAETAVSVRVKPKAHWHFNLDFPTSVQVAVPPGASAPNHKQGLADAIAKSEQEGATWEVKVTAAQPGGNLFTADLRFAVCTATTCDPKSQKVAFQLDVQ